MSAFQLGPFVLSAPRLFAAIGLVVLLVAAEVVARRRAGPRVRAAPTGAAWAWNAAIAVLLGSRLGYVIENLALFAQQPVAILQFWQGGYSPWWGIAAGAVVTGLAVWRKRVTLHAALVPAVLGLAAWLAVPALLSPAETQAQSLPNIALERLEGGELDLASLRGQPIVLNLWATWCLPCRRELPMLEAAANSYPDVHFVFADQGEPRATVQGYLDDEGFVLRNVLLDSRSRLGDTFGSIGLPTTLFFDAAGDHVMTHVGELSSVMMINYLSDLRRGTLGQ
ncbi:MAG: TlpA family protein disulfide reductase [Trueperaceae bacterium]|nr:TlpA family protein disulfide reductase [Trueperaceae bacterium]